MSAALPVRVLVVLGTRPEAIKLAPVVRALKGDASFDTLVVLTGQHREMVTQILEPFEIEPDESLDIMERDQSLNGIMERALPRLDDLYRQTEPALVLVQGDTTSALCAALGAFHRRIPGAHVEAGLRSRDRFHPYPEEVNRRMISAVVDLHFAPTRSCAENLLREGVEADRLFVTGNTVIDSLIMTISDEELLQRHRWQGKLTGDGRLVVVTLHRRESWLTAGSEEDNSTSPLQGLLSALSASARRHPDVDFVYPVHLNPRVREPVWSILDGIPNVHLLDQLPYLSFVELMCRAEVVLTDSGGIQEEAPSIGVLVLVARRTTERHETLETGAGRLVGFDGCGLEEELTQMLCQPRRRPVRLPRPSPFGDGRASDRIRSAILNYFGRADRPRDFRVADEGGTAPRRSDHEHER